jgi:hypothetical protein
VGLLQLLQNNKDRVEAVFDSAAVMARLLPKYAAVEAHYKDWKTDRQKEFEDRIVDVYTAILRYAGEAVGLSEPPSNTVDHVGHRFHKAELSRTYVEEANDMKEIRPASATRSVHLEPAMTIFW